MVLVVEESLYSDSVHEPLNQPSVSCLYPEDREYSPALITSITTGGGASVITQNIPQTVDYSVPAVALCTAMTTLATAHVRDTVDAHL
jgi:hypothetical protein